MKKRWIALAAASLVALGAAGCAQVGYYVQAAHGQMSLLSSARPIDDWLADPAAPVALKAKLDSVRKIRRFAADELGLPDNGSYTSYAELHRPFVLWNVVATPALSLKPEQWCFPVAGCVTYRGYYSREDAQSFANALRREGLDVQVAGVPAYSTLGWFNDPVLSSFIQYPEPELARLLFHELAHQVAYAPGDSAFNEAFATAVEEAGIEHWLAMRGSAALRATYAESQRRREAFHAILDKARHALEKVYASDGSDAERRRGKEAVFAALQDDYRALRSGWGGYPGYDRWFAEPLGNAHLASISTYHEMVPAFRLLLAREKSLPNFYAAARSLAKLDKAERRARLEELGSSAAAMTASTGAIGPGIGMPSR